ncbi:crotonobetainyl-CoA--carnitine CoA-transferase [Micromonospora sp. NPDC005220]|uniref:crotonobetainyl-CoA--carnitine CoA-transferase n=1 Tax=Micromonospora sp. NPDC005220 TaxID=3155589 RepID=UPI0033B6CCC5
MDLDPASIADIYLDRHFPGRKIVPPVLRQLDEDFCRQVGAWFDQVPVRPEPETIRLYEMFKRETHAQYEALVESGLRVEPWLDPGRPQPYVTSRQLCSEVRDTGVLHIYLTAHGHGDGPARSSGHPMTEATEVRVNGVQFCYNDLFRAVHDFFGHVMHGNTFGPRGEFKATYDHMQMYSAEVRPVLAAETIAQICWFFYGPHLSGEHIPPARRPFSEQKPVLFPEHLMTRYLSLFERMPS